MSGCHMQVFTKEIFHIREIVPSHHCKTLGQKTISIDHATDQPHIHGGFMDAFMQYPAAVIKNLIIIFYHKENNIVF